MKERPIIFSGEMARAILEGRKTQTRRVIKPQPTTVDDERQRVLYQKVICGEEGPFITGEWKSCPYGQVGDRLWVKEKHRLFTPIAVKYIVVDYPSSYGKAEDVRATRHIENISRLIFYPRWRPSIHMPRWASRILLEITNIRVERLQEISEDDAVVEGFRTLYPKFEYEHALEATPSKPLVDIGSIGFSTDSFLLTWDSLNAKRGYGWDTNPWVWVISFKKVTGG